MQNQTNTNPHKAVTTWLMMGVVMIIVQILIGGITRLTESGLSITEWKPITGFLLPGSEAAWMVEFEKYRNTDQFKYVHQHFTLSDFKFIFFWEWFHRVWARLLGVVFIVGFGYLLYKKKLTKKMVLPLIILFVLGGMQGFIGWIMVASGLVPEMYYVGHVELTTHFIAAIILLIYTLWFTLSLKPSFQQKVNHPNLKKLALTLIILVLVQFVFGGFMAGLKAAKVAATWPDINGAFLPAQATLMEPFGSNLVNNPLMIHFIHRNLAYLIAILVIVFFVKARKVKDNPLFARLNTYALGLLILQVILGIGAVLFSTQPNTFTWVGVSHQFVGMLLIIQLTSLYYLLRSK